MKKQTRTTRANTTRLRPDGSIHSYRSRTAASHTVRSTEDYESLEIIHERTSGRIEVTVELSSLEVEDKTVVGLPALTEQERRMLTAPPARAETEPLARGESESHHRRHRIRSARIMGTWMFGECQDQ